MTKIQNSKRGHFITIYGVNNIGKTTHARLLVEKLKKEGFDAVYIKYPIYDLEPTGKRLNTILRGKSKQTISEKELQALFKQNRLNFEPQLEQMLKRNKIVVAEDYTGTGIAWGMAKGLTQHFMEKLNAGLLKEDFAILLTGKPDATAKETRHIHEQNTALLKSVNKIFVHLGGKYAWHSVKLAPKIEDTAEKMWRVIRKFLN